MSWWRGFIVIAATGLTLFFNDAASANGLKSWMSLIGLNGFSVNISVSGGNAAKWCGINKSRAESSLRFILQQSHMRVESDADTKRPNANIIVAINAVANKAFQQCGVSMELVVMTPVSIMATKQLWLAGQIWSFPAVGFGP